jgi:hypothetical protein
MNGTGKMPNLAHDFPGSQIRNSAKGGTRHEAMASRRAAMADTWSILHPICKAVIDPTLPYGDVEFWLTKPIDGDAPIASAAVAPPDALGKTFRAGTIVRNVRGREVIVTPVADVDFRNAASGEAARFDDLYKLHKRYFEGCCHHFAIAAQRVTGLPLGVLWDDLRHADRNGGIREIIHVYLQLPDGSVFDYGGIRSQEDMRIDMVGSSVVGTSFGNITESDLRDTFVEPRWMYDWDEEDLLQALDVIREDAALLESIEMLALGGLAATAAKLQVCIQAGMESPDTQTDEVTPDVGPEEFDVFVQDLRERLGAAGLPRIDIQRQGLASIGNLVADAMPQPTKERIMDILIEVADDHELHLSLRVSLEDDTDDDIFADPCPDAAQVSWYRNYGFELVSRSGSAMIRKAETSPRNNPAAGPGCF